jgi:hypothetical protein
LQAGETLNRHPLESTKFLASASFTTYDGSFFSIPVTSLQPSTICHETARASLLSSCNNLAELNAILGWRKLVLGPDYWVASSLFYNNSDAHRSNQCYDRFPAQGYHGGESGGGSQVYASAIITISKNIYK